MPRDDTAATVLLSYVSLLAACNAYAPGGGFEYRLWDVLASEPPSDLLSREERNELRFLVEKTGQWVTFDLETGRFALTDVYAWLELRRHE